MSQHTTCYVISYHEILCHDMSYVTTIMASLAISLNHSTDITIRTSLFNHFITNFDPANSCTFDFCVHVQDAKPLNFCDI